MADQVSYGDIVVQRTPPTCTVLEAPETAHVPLATLRGAPEIFIAGDRLYLGCDPQGREVSYRITGWDPAQRALTVERVTPVDGGPSLKAAEPAVEPGPSENTPEPATASSGDPGRPTWYATPDERMAEMAEAIARELGTDFDTEVHRDVVRRAVDRELCADEAADEIRCRTTAARVRAEVAEEIAAAIEAGANHEGARPSRDCCSRAVDTWLRVTAHLVRKYAEPGPVSPYDLEAVHRDMSKRRRR